jgi:hypothetical protein
VTSKNEREIVYKKNTYTVDDFVKKYSYALAAYMLANQIKDGHIVDLAINNASFAEAFYQTVEALTE